MNRPLNITLPALLISISMKGNALACAVCTGSADAPIAPAMNASMVFLLAAIAVVGSMFFGFLIYLARRDGLPANVNQELSGEMESPISQQS